MMYISSTQRPAPLRMKCANRLSPGNYAEMRNVHCRQNVAEAIVLRARECGTSVAQRTEPISTGKVVSGATFKRDPATLDLISGPSGRSSRRRRRRLRARSPPPPPPPPPTATTRRINLSQRRRSRHVLSSEGGGDRPGCLLLAIRTGPHLLN